MHFFDLDLLKLSRYVYALLQLTLLTSGTVVLNK